MDVLVETVVMVFDNCDSHTVLLSIVDLKKNQPLLSLTIQYMPLLKFIFS